MKICSCGGKYAGSGKGECERRAMESFSCFLQATGSRWSIEVTNWPVLNSCETETSVAKRTTAKGPSGVKVSQPAGCAQKGPLASSGVKVSQPVGCAQVATGELSRRLVG